MINIYTATENAYAESELKENLKKILKGDVPIVVCIGTDAVTGDSLGPLVGSLLKKKAGGLTYVFGSMENPVTATDVASLKKMIKGVYPYSRILAVDAALGSKAEVGSVKLSDGPIKPGLGVNKDLGEIGDASIIGVVDEKKKANASLYSVRLSRVYFQAELISSAVARYLEETVGDGKKRNFSFSD